MKIAILNGTLVDPASNTHAPRDVFIADHKIAALGAAPDGFVADRTIDATDLIVSPGFVDLCARLREPGFEYKATLESEMAAAAAGGVTTLICPPDTDPPLDEPGLVEMLRSRAKASRGPRVHPMGALTVGMRGERITEMAVLAEKGCIAFSQADVPLYDTLVLMRAMQYAVTFGYPLVMRAEDPYLAKDGVAHEGQISSRLGLPPISPLAETIALARLIALARATGVRLHVARISCADSVELVRAAKKEGLGVSCDVAVHHVHLSEIDIGYFDSRYRLTPPLRSLRDRDALRAGLKDGTIDAIVSDHAPVDEDEKQLPFGEAEPGAIGLELLLPLTLKWATEDKIPLGQALAKITHHAARVLGAPGGALTVGGKADLALFHPTARWTVEGVALKSQGHNTPYFGLELEGQVRHTVVDGELVYSHMSAHQPAHLPTHQPAARR
jgi:dihydroorotase